MVKRNYAVAQIRGNALAPRLHGTIWFCGTPRGVRIIAQIGGLHFIDGDGVNHPKMRRFQAFGFHRPFTIPAKKRALKYDTMSEISLKGMPG